jgi:hypothetical protein
MRGWILVLEVGDNVVQVFSTDTHLGGDGLDNIADAGMSRATSTRSCSPAAPRAPSWCRRRTRTLGCGRRRSCRFKRSRQRGQRSASHARWASCDRMRTVPLGGDAWHWLDFAIEHEKECPLDLSNVEGVREAVGAVVKSTCKVDVDAIAHSADRDRRDRCIVITALGAS